MADRCQGPGLSSLEVDQLGREGSQAYHNVVRLQVSVHIAHGVELLDALSNHREDLVDLPVISVLSQPLAQVHVVLLHRQQDVVGSKKDIL